MASSFPPTRRPVLQLQTAWTGWPDARSDSATSQLQQQFLQRQQEHRQQSVPSSTRMPEPSVPRRQHSFPLRLGPILLEEPSEEFDDPHPAAVSASLDRPIYHHGWRPHQQRPSYPDSAYLHRSPSPGPTTSTGSLCSLDTLNHLEGLEGLEDSDALDCDQRHSVNSSASFFSARRHSKRSPGAGASLNLVTLEARDEKRAKQDVKKRRMVIGFAWMLGLVLEGWSIWLCLRYLLAYIMYTDTGIRSQLNLIFFILSFWSTLTILLPLLVVLPPFQLVPASSTRNRPSQVLRPLALLLPPLASLLLITVAAAQLVLANLWFDVLAPLGLVGRCGWDMDVVWGVPGSCETYRWDGWLGVLGARFGGTVLLIALFHLTLFFALRDNDPTLQFVNRDGGAIRLPGSPHLLGGSHLPPTTLIDRHNPHVLSEDFLSSRHHRCHSADQRRHGGHRSSKMVQQRSHHAEEHQQQHLQQHEQQMGQTAYFAVASSAPPCSSNNSPTNQRIERGYFRSVTQQQKQQQEHTSPLVDLSLPSPLSCAGSNATDKTVSQAAHRISPALCNVPCKPAPSYFPSGQSGPPPAATAAAAASSRRTTPSSSSESEAEESSARMPASIKRILLSPRMSMRRGAIDVGRAGEEDARAVPVASAAPLRSELEEEGGVDGDEPVSNRRRMTDEPSNDSLASKVRGASSLVLGKGPRARKEDSGDHREVQYSRAKKVI